MPLLRGMRSAAKYIWIGVFIAFVGGFLLLETSGLLGSDAISPSTVVATVDGGDILYVEFAPRVDQAVQAQSDQMGRVLTLDESKAVENRVLEEMILDRLMQKEYKRRGITVTDDEIRQAAERMPPPQLVQSPLLQTDGAFDMAKYRRFLGSPEAQETGLLLNLEAYYRTEIPRLKLFEQVTADVYVSDAEMYRKWQEVRDSVQVSFVAMTADMLTDTAGIVATDAEIRRYYDLNKKEFESSSRALVSVVRLPRIVTAADSAAALAKITALRSEITDSASFVEVTRRESTDTATAGSGGELGKTTRGTYTSDFEDAAYRLRVGQVSDPVLTSIGYHLIRLDARAGDTLTLRHLLVEIGPSDAATLELDRRADTLSSLTAYATEAEQFDRALATLGLTAAQELAFEGQPLLMGGMYVPSVSAWAFSGAEPGESSDLFESDAGYFLARLDSLEEGGPQPLAAVRETIAQRVKQKKKLEALLPRARELASKAAATTLESAAAEYSTSVQQSQMFTRISFVQGIGQNNEAIGAAFELPVGSVGAPVLTDDAVFILRVDKRVNADRGDWEAQRELQRTLLTQSAEQEKVQRFLDGLREQAKVVDRRKEIARLSRIAP